MFKNYIKIAWRNLVKNKVYSGINIIGLAIGLTAGFLILLFVNFELSYDGFHTKGDRIYRVVADIKTPSENIEANKPAWAVPLHLEKQFPEVESAVRVAGRDMLIRKDDLKFKETGILAADPNFFNVFDFELIKGNPADVIKEPFSMVLSESMVKKYFGDQDPIGKTLKITEDSHIATITGVMKDMPKNSHINADMIISMTTYTQSLNKNLDTAWGGYNPFAYILLSPGTNPDQLAAKFPDFLERNDGENMKKSKMYVTLFLEPFKELYLHSNRGGTGGGSMDIVYIFSVIAIFILIIAAINFINLTTARSVERAKEVGIRKVIGADKGQLAFQFVGESVIISCIAFLIAVGLSILLLPLFNELAGKTVSSGVLAVPMNLVVLFLISIGIGMIAGIYPAIVLSSFKPVSVLKGRFSTGSKGVLLRKGLVISQFTISIVLIIGTIIIYNQMNYMRTQELGFNKEQMLILETNSTSSQTALKQMIDKIPGVVSTSLGSSVPGKGNSMAYSEIENRDGDLQVANLDLYFIDYDYISQFGLKVLAGRPFSRDFSTDSTEAMILNEKAVKLLGYSDPKDAIGANYKQWGSEGRIVGVIKDFHFESLDENIAPLTMRIQDQSNELIAVKISSENTKQVLSSIKDKWQSILTEEPFDYYFLDEFFDRQYRSEERFGNLFLNFSILAILISCLGLLGLAAYSTLQRRREIGIRKVIGASVSGIVNLLSKEFIMLVGIAFIIASPIAWFMMHQWLEDFAYKTPIEWWMFVLAGVSALIIALGTISFHALKASLINPVKILRTE